MSFSSYYKVRRKEIQLERGACLLDRPTFLCSTGLVRLTGPGRRRRASKA
jgi:hypothetical protein